MKSNLIIFLTIFSFLFGCTNKKQKQLRIDDETSNASSIYISKAEDNSLPIKVREQNNTKALSLLTNIKSNDSLNRANLFRVATQFYILGNYPEFKYTTRIVLHKASDVKDTLQIIRAYNYLGKYQTDLSINDSAFFYYTKAEKLSLKLRDSVNLGGIYINKAFIQLYENDFSGCELSASKALNVLKNGSDKRKIYDAYNLVGISSNEMKSYDRAIDYHNRALKIVRDNDLNDASHLGSNSLNNIGVVYQNMDKHNRAISYFEDALKEQNLLKDSPSLYSILLDNLAYSKFRDANFKNLPGLFYNSLKIRDSLKLSSGIVINKIHLSEYYSLMKDSVLAQKFAKEALTLSRTSKISGDILGSLKQISAVEHKNAARYSREYIRINDSLQQSERKIKDRFARIQFETDEILHENDKLNEQNRKILYFFVGTLMIGLLLFVIRSQRAKNRELLLKQAQQKANEDIYNLMITQQNKIEEGRIAEKKRIAQELHDGVLGRLFGTRLNLDSLNKMSDENSITKRNNYLSELKNIEQDIREISHDLNREKYVLINNFVAILNNLLEEQNASFDAEVIVNVDDNIKWESVSNTLKINLYRIIQEGLQNINKYAQAKTIKLELKKVTDNLVISIADDGVGFAVNNKKKGIGLQNMLSRANDLEGIFEIKSKKGKGTIINVTFPIGNKQIITI